MGAPHVPGHPPRAQGVWPLLRLTGRFLDAFEDAAVFLLFGVAVILYFSQVVSRYLFGFTFPWAEELIVTLVVWACFIGASLAVRHKAHISVDLLVRKLPAAPHRIAALAALGISTLFVLLMFVWGVQFVRFMALTGNQAESIDMPAYPLYMAVPLGGALMTIRLLQEVWRVLQPGWAPGPAAQHAPDAETGSR